MIKRIITIVVAVLTLLIIGCTSTRVQFNTSGRKIVYEDGQFIPSVVLLNIDTDDKLIMEPDVNNCYGWFKFCSNNGEFIGICLAERSENMFNKFDLINNESFIYKFNSISHPKTISEYSFNSAKDSLLISLNGQHLYLSKKDHYENMKRIDLHKNKYAYIALGSYGRIAAMAEMDTDYFSYRFINRKKLFVYNYWSNKLDSIEMLHHWISNWSPDGNQIMTCDSTLCPEIVSYPEMRVKKYDRILPDSLALAQIPYFIDNHLLILNVAMRKDLKNLIVNSNLYLYDLIERRIIRQLTKSDTPKELCDVTFK